MQPAAPSSPRACIRTPDAEAEKKQNNREFVQLCCIVIAAGAAAIASIAKYQKYPRVFEAAVVVGTFDVLTLCAFWISNRFYQSGA